MTGQVRDASGHTPTAKCPRRDHPPFPDPCPLACAVSADLVELIRLHLDEKAALLDENAALRRLVTDKLGEEELHSAVLPVSTASGLSAETVRATEDGVQRFMVLAAHAEIVRLKAESAAAAAIAKAEADRLKAEMAALQADARRHSEEVERLHARLAEQSSQLSALEALAGAADDGAGSPDAAGDEQQQPAEERSGDADGGGGDEETAELEAHAAHLSASTSSAANRLALRSGVVQARVAAAEGELQAAQARGDVAEQRAEHAEQRALAAERTLEAELAAAETRAEAALASARAETAAELDRLRMAAATAHKAANDSAAALARAVAAREAAETESARAQAALRASETARANMSQQVAIAEQARRDEAATVVDLQRALADSHAAVRAAAARGMWRLAGARVRQQAKWRAAVGAAAHAVRTAGDAAAADTRPQRAVVVTLRIVGDGPATVTSPGDGQSAEVASEQLRAACAAATAEAADAKRAAAAAEERLERLQAVVRQQRAELDGVQQSSTASADAVTKEAAQRVQAAEQRAAAATAELQAEAARYKDKLRFFAEEVKRRDDAAKADAAVAADLRSRMAAAEAAARSREEAAAASCAAREADLTEALHDAQRQANAAGELRAHMAQLAHARDKAESELMTTSLRVAQLEGRVRLLDEGLTTARHALEREALTRERLEAQLADTQAGSATAAAARDAERRAQEAEAAVAEAAAKLQEAQAEAQRLRDVLAAEDSDSPRLKQLRLRAEVAEEGVARLRREVAYVEEQCAERVRQAEAQLRGAQQACEERLVAMRGDVAAAQTEASHLASECEVMLHKVHTYRDEFTAWRERARAWMEAKDAELDAAAGRRGGATPPTPAGPPLALPQALGIPAPSSHAVAPSSPALQTPARGSSPPSERRVNGRHRVSETPSHTGDASGVLPLAGDDERVTYLRNVLLKFLATSSWSTQQSLVPVLATLLSFTEGEKQQVAQARQQLAPVSSSSITQLLPLGLPSPFR